MAETPFTPVAPEGQPEQPAAAPAEAAAVPAEAAAVPAAEPVQEAMAPAAEAPAEEPVAPEEEPVAPETEPSIATTLEVAPLPEAGATGGSEAGAEGGEFDLLIGKISAWLEGLELAERWQKLRGPLRGAALLLALLLVLRLYGRVVGTIDGIPVISGLLELTGLIYALWFSATKLIRTSERERVLADWKQRWQAFTGRD